MGGGGVKAYLTTVVSKVSFHACFGAVVSQCLMSETLRRKLLMATRKQRNTHTHRDRETRCCIGKGPMLPFKDMLPDS